jgi:hypothetical protein
MNEADVNLLPLATAGDWMRNPRTYKRRRSWLRAVLELSSRGRSRGPRPLRRALRAFAETSWSTKLELREAPTFVRLNRRFLRAYDSRPGWLRPWRRLAAELRLVKAAPVRLRALPDRAFADQAVNFLDAARQAAGAGQLGTNLLAAERPALRVRSGRRGFLGSARPPNPDAASDIRARYEPERDQSKKSRYFTYGWRTPYAFEVPPYPVPDNVMDLYLDAVDSRDSAWQDHSDQAASRVTLTLRGRRVRLSPSGAFRLKRRMACGRLLVATDGAGGRTAVRLRRCRR